VAPLQHQAQQGAVGAHHLDVDDLAPRRQGCLAQAGRGSWHAGVRSWHDALPLGVITPEKLLALRRKPRTSPYCVNSAASSSAVVSRGRPVTWML
jgi:hypothetical protein